MHLVIIGWLYVVAMMAAAEAASPQGSVIGAVFTFVLYGAAPVSLVVYLMGRPKRRPRDSAAPDGSGEAPADAVAPVGEEP